MKNVFNRSQNPFAYINNFSLSTTSTFSSPRACSFLLSCCSFCCSRCWCRCWCCCCCCQCCCCCFCYSFYLITKKCSKGHSAVSFFPLQPSWDSRCCEENFQIVALLILSSTFHFFDLSAYLCFPLSLFLFLYISLSFILSLFAPLFLVYLILSASLFFFP